MIPSNPMRTVKDYGSSAQYLEAPSDEEIAKGTIPLDTLPAAWWNWMWRDTNSAVNEAKTGMTSIVTEIVNVLTAANIQPSQLTENQLLSAIRVIAQQYGTSTTAGAVKSSTASGKLNIEAAGTAVINGLGTPTSLNTTNKVVVAAVNEILAALNAYIQSNNTAVGALQTAVSTNTTNINKKYNYKQTIEDGVDVELRISGSSPTRNLSFVVDKAGTKTFYGLIDQNGELMIAKKADLDSHKNSTRNVHGAVSTPTANKIIIRDENGRAQVAAPVSNDDIATKKYVDDQTSSPFPTQFGTVILEKTNTAGETGTIEIPTAGFYLIELVGGKGGNGGGGSGGTGGTGGAGGDGELVKEIRYLMPGTYDYQIGGAGSSGGNGGIPDGGAPGVGGANGGQNGGQGGNGATYTLSGTTYYLLGGGGGGGGGGKTIFSGPSNTVTTTVIAIGGAGGGGGGGGGGGASGGGASGGGGNPGGGGGSPGGVIGGAGGGGGGGGVGCGGGGGGGGVNQGRQGGLGIYGSSLTSRIPGGGGPGGGNFAKQTSSNVSYIKITQLKV